MGKSHHAAYQLKYTDPLGDALASLRQHPGDGQRHGRRDFLGIVLAAMLFTILLARGAGECAVHLVDVEASRRAARGEYVLQETLDAVSAYPFDAIAKLDDPGGRTCVPADPDFDVDLGVTNVQSGLLRIEAVVVDNETHREVGKFVTYRRRT